MAKWCSRRGDRSKSRVAESSRRRSAMRSNCLRAIAKPLSLVTAALRHSSTESCCWPRVRAPLVELKKRPRGGIRRLHGRRLPGSPHAWHGGGTAFESRQDIRQSAGRARTRRIARDRGDCGAAGHISLWDALHFEMTIMLVDVSTGTENRGKWREYGRSARSPDDAFMDRRLRTDVIKATTAGRDRRSTHGVVHQDARP